MRFSVCPNLYDPPQPVEASWDDFIQSIRAPIVSTNKQGSPLFTPAAFPPGSPRQMEYVESLAFGVIDYDHLNAEDARELLAFLQTLTFRWALSTSYSHGATLKSGDEHKSKNPVGTVEYAYRVFFPFLSPVPGKEWPQFWQRLNDLFTLPSGRVRPDPKCKN